MTMRTKKTNVDLLLRKALSSSETPAPELVRNVKYQFIKEEPFMKKSTIKRSFGTVAAAVIALAIFTTTAFAAWYFLKPSEVANRLGDKTLSAAFGTKTADIESQSITSGNYTFTLLGVVSGKDITDNPTYNSNGDILSDRTYTVVAIRKKDGSPMPSAQDADYPSFYVSPYIKGFKPWQVNAHTLNGGHIETVIDGVMYRIVDCDEVSVFADRGIYLGVNTGSFYDSKAFNYDEVTGVITANPDYDGSSIVFDLPIDKSLANPEKAEHYLGNLLDKAENDAPSLPGGAYVGSNPPELIQSNGTGTGTRHIMTYDEYKAWSEKKLDEAKALVKQGKYSEASLELDRRDYENNLKEIENGGTLTLIEYANGDYSVSITYPVDGYDVSVGDDGGIFISGN